MEKTMTVEEKIRKAQEIYNRRNANSYYKYSSPKEKKSSSLMSRMVRQMIFCIIIYGIFYVVTNREYFLSEEFDLKAREVVSQNETLDKTYSFVRQYLEKYFIKSENKTEEITTENENNTENQLEEINTNENNIGGASNVNEEVTINQEKTQEEQDVDYIKNNISFIRPIEGTITSTFGWRNPTTATVPKYHTGLDIGAKTGTIIKSATDGIVQLASSEGDYGNHYKIAIDNIIIIYAHCSKLYLKEGDRVTQGQEIAEVGTTGNSTRTTFTF